MLQMSLTTQHLYWPHIKPTITFTLTSDTVNSNIYSVCRYGHV